MAELDELEAGYAEAIHHTNKVLATAEDVLVKFRTSKPMGKISYGSRELTRCGGKRQVQFLEAEDGSGPALRIEVFVLQPTEVAVEGATD